MKNITKAGVYGLSVGLATLFVGCASEKIMVDYVMPAAAVADVSKVNVAAIRVKTNVRGNLAGDQKLNAGLVKQLLAMRLYKEGFYKVTDDIWSTSDGAAAIHKMIADRDSGHGYASLGAMGQGAEKVIIDLDLDLELASNPIEKAMSFNLSKVPYTKKPGKNGAPSTSEPNAKAIVVEKVSQNVKVYELAAKGVLKAKFVGVDGGDAPQDYEKSFDIAIPEDNRVDVAPPTQLKALALAVTPAINGIVSDISPYRQTRELVAIKGGDDRVVELLNAKAFPEVIIVVERLAVTGKANSADLQNLGIAQEAIGNFTAAKMAYQSAVKADPESVTAKEGLKRVVDALASKKAVKASGAKQDADTNFSK